MIESTGPRYIREVQSRVAPLVSVALFSILLGVACEPLDDSGEPEECELLEDEDAATATPTTITIENVGDVPLFLHDGPDSNDLLWFFVDGDPVVDDQAFPLLRCAGAD